MLLIAALSTLEFNPMIYFISLFNKSKGGQTP